MLYFVMQKMSIILEVQLFSDCSDSQCVQKAYIWIMEPFYMK